MLFAGTPSVANPKRSGMTKQVRERAAHALGERQQAMRIDARHRQHSVRNLEAAREDWRQREIAHDGHALHLGEAAAREIGGHEFFGVALRDEARALRVEHGVLGVELDAVGFYRWGRRARRRARGAWTPT